MPTPRKAGSPQGLGALAAGTFEAQSWHQPKGLPMIFLIPLLIRPIARLYRRYRAHRTTSAAAQATGDSKTAGRKQQIVVVGGGFAGLQVVRGLRHAPVEVTLIDRQNFTLFQP